MYPFDDSEYCNNSINYGDSEMFFNIINNAHKFSYNSGRAGVVLEIVTDYCTIYVSGEGCFKTDFIKNMPFDEFLKRTKSVLDSLLTENGDDWGTKRLAGLANSYNAAMKSCQIKRAN